MSNRATAEVIDFESVRQSRRLKSAGHQPGVSGVASGMVMVVWVPIWMMVPTCTGFSTAVHG